MKTDDFIGLLTRGAGAADTAVVPRRIAVALSLGLTASLAGALIALGPVPVAAWGASSTGVKLVYASGLIAALSWLVARMARPAAPIAAASILALAVAMAMALVGGAALVAAPPSARSVALFGQSALFCPFAILVLSILPTAALLRAMRGLAPTRPALAGLAVGLLAGSVGALGYALTCVEGSPAFVAVWYTLGILLSGLAGSVIGGRYLRW